MPSKMVLDRTRAVAQVLSLLFTHVDEIAARIAELLAPHVPPGAKLPDLVVLLRTVGRLIRSRLEKLVTFNKAHRDEVDDDLEARERRDEAFDGLYRQMVDKRRLAEAAYGKLRAKELIAVDGAVSTVPDTLLEQGQHSMERFRKPPHELPPVKARGLAPDPAQWADEMEPFVIALDGALNHVNRDRSQFVDSVELKSQAMKDLDFIYAHGVAVLRGFLFLAGRPDLGKRLPGVRRTRRLRRGPNPREERPDRPPTGDSPDPPSDDSPSGDSPSGDSPSDDSPSDDSPTGEPSNEGDSEAGSPEPPGEDGGEP